MFNAVTVVWTLVHCNWYKMCSCCVRANQGWKLLMSVKPLQPVWIVDRPVSLNWFLLPVSIPVLIWLTYTCVHIDICPLRAQVYFGLDWGSVFTTPQAQAHCRLTHTHMGRACSKKYLSETIVCVCMYTVNIEYMYMWVCVSAGCCVHVQLHICAVGFTFWLGGSGWSAWTSVGLQ